LFLNSYRDNGVWATATLEDAKIFSACPTFAASLLNAQILVVLVNCDGSGVRRTLLRVPTCASTPGRESLALEKIRSTNENAVRKSFAGLMRGFRNPIETIRLLLGCSPLGALGILIVAVLLRAFLGWLGR